MAKTWKESLLKLSLLNPLTRRGKSAKPKDKPLKHKCKKAQSSTFDTTLKLSEDESTFTVSIPHFLSGMMNTITMGLLICHHPQGAEAEWVEGVTLTPMIITATKTITITMDTIITTTGVAMTTHTIAMRTSRGPGEGEA